MNESDFEKELRSLYQKKQTEGNRIILMTNQKNSNFELRVDSKELYNRLCKKSIELEYGEASLMEKKIL